jgi:flagellar basal-body rod protein FlgF
MDRLIYVAMTGASQALEQQATIANNLANASTTGFKAQLSAARAVPLETDAQVAKGDTTRTYVLTSTPRADMSSGAIQQTGNPLDVAVQGSGWFAVQTADGQEGYTRAGNFHVDQNGQLVNASGLQVVGNGGPISVPPGAQVNVSDDGTISALGAGDPTTSVAILDKLKLVNPDADSMVRGDDGLFRTGDGNAADADPSVRVTSGAIEGSNVNPVTAMVDMIANARSYQMHLKLVETADKNEQSANQLLNFNN